MDIASFIVGIISLILGAISLWITIPTMQNTKKIKKIMDLNDLKAAYKESNTYRDVSMQLSQAKTAVKDALENNSSCKPVILNPLISAFSDLSPYYDLFESDKDILVQDSENIKSLHNKDILTYDDISNVSDIINRTYTAIIKRGGNK